MNDGGIHQQNETTAANSIALIRRAITKPLFKYLSLS
jgi:hypothetical protein